MLFPYLLEGNEMDFWKIATYLYKQYKMNWKGTKYLIDRVWLKKDFKDCL